MVLSLRVAEGLLLRSQDHMTSNPIFCFYSGLLWGPVFVNSIYLFSFLYLSSPINTHTYTCTVSGNAHIICSEDSNVRTHGKFNKGKVLS